MKRKQLVAWVLTAVMTVSALPGNVFAEAVTDAEPVAEEVVLAGDAAVELPAQEEDVLFEDSAAAVEGAADFTDILEADVEAAGDAAGAAVGEDVLQFDEAVSVEADDAQAQLPGSEADQLQAELTGADADAALAEAVQAAGEEAQAVETAAGDAAQADTLQVELPGGDDELPLEDGFAVWEEPAAEGAPEDQPIESVAEVETEAAQVAGDAAQVAGDAAQAEGDAAQVEGEAAQVAGDAAPAEGESAVEFETETFTEEAEALFEETQEEPDASQELAANEYTVKFDANGGTWKSGYETTYAEAKTVEENDYLYVPDDYELERSGYKLLGWSEAKDGTVVCDAGNAYYPAKNVTLYAKWEKLLTVKYDVNGGTWDSYYEDDYGTAKQVAKGDETYIPGTYVANRAGYKLLGWTTVKDTGAVLEEYSYYTVNADVTFYAKWEKLLTVKFDVNGGAWTDDYYKEQYSKAQSMEKGETLWLPSSYNLERTGYKMAGWTLTKDTGAVISNSEYTVTKDVTFYAKWEKLYVVKFDPNGGTWKSGINYKDVRYVEKGEEIYLPSDYALERKGYILKGWTRIKDSGAILDDEDYVIASDETFYAKWAKASTIKFNANGGTWTSDYDKTRYTAGVLTENGTEVYLPSSYALERKGYILKGWTLKKNKGSVLDEYTATKNVTLYAKWAKAYTITFNAGKGYFGSKKSKTYKIQWESGRAIGYALTDSDYYPVNGKQSFAGWYKDAKLKKPAKKSDIIKKNTTYYAKWYTKSYKITVTNLKGASYHNRATDDYVDSEKSTANSYSFYIAQGDSIGSLYAYKNGAEAYFYFDKACKEKPFYSSYIPTKNTTVYAKFITQINIKWDANGGHARYNSNTTTGTISSDKNLMCEDMPEVERNGYYFIGWVDTAKPKKILPASHVFTKDTTIKAKWAKAIHITLKANGGNFGSDQNKITKYEFDMKAKTRIGSAKTYISFPYRKGYTLTGWKSSVTKKTVKDLYSQKPAKSTTYTAVWKKIASGSKVKVTLMGEAGSIYKYDVGDEYSTYVAKKVVEVEKNITYGKSVLSGSEHDEPSKKLSFAGWSLKKNGKVLDVNYKFTKAVTLYPVWNKRKPPVRVVLVTNGGAIDKIPSNRPNTYWSVSSANNNGITFNLPTAKNMEREGYKLAGWYTDYKLKKKIANPAKFKTSKTCYVYAKWTKK